MASALVVPLHQGQCRQSGWLLSELRSLSSIDRARPRPGPVSATGPRVGLPAASLWCSPPRPGPTASAPGPRRHGRPTTPSARSPSPGPCRNRPGRFVLTHLGFRFSPSSIQGRRGRFLHQHVQMANRPTPQPARFTLACPSTRSSQATERAAGRSPRRTEMSPLLPGRIQVVGGVTGRSCSRSPFLPSCQHPGKKSKVRFRPAVDHQVPIPSGPRPGFGGQQTDFGQGQLA